MCSYPHYIIYVADLQGVLFLLHLRYNTRLLLFFAHFVWYTRTIEMTKGECIPMKLDLSNLSNIQSRPIQNDDLKDFPANELDQLSVLRDDEQHTKTRVDEEMDKVIDMSDIKTEVVEIFPDAPTEELPPKQNWFTKTWHGVAMWTWLLIVAVCIAAIAFIWALAPKGDANADALTTEVSETEPQTTYVYNEKLSQAATESVTESPEEVARQELIKQASISNIPYSVAVGQIGGGYLLGATTYHPNDPSKSYIDYTIVAPATEETALTTDKVKEIEKKLTSNLPNIGDIIKVKDGSKVTVKTFQHEGSYTTVIFYDGKPFAYAVTGDDGHSLTHVTSYYVTTVAADQ